VERLRIAQVENPGVFDYSLDEDLDARLGHFISLVVLDAGSPGGFRASAFDARCVIRNVRVVDRWTGGWASEDEAVVVEVPVGVGNEPPEVLDAVGAIVRDLEEDGREGVVDANKVVVSGLSCNGEEGQCGGSEG
jgi:hypothetical protein